MIRISKIRPPTVFAWPTIEHKTKTLSSVLQVHNKRRNSHTSSVSYVPRAGSAISAAPVTREIRSKSITSRSINPQTQRIA
jgi:hypothetical protein